MSSRILFLFCILFGVFDLIKSDGIACKFKKDTDYACGCEFYGCFADDLKVLDSNKIYDSVSGSHQSYKSITDVKHLGVRNSKVLFMPQRLDRLFNLTSLLILGTSLMKIQSDDFIGLKDLEYLHLGNNMLNYLPSDVFSRIEKVKFITLRDNYIEELPKDIFKNNLQLEGLWIYNNNFKYISPTIFNHLTKLNRVSVKGKRHTCLNKDYDGIDKIQHLKEDVIKCANPNEVSLVNSSEITAGEIFNVLDQCKINTEVFIKIVKSIHTNYRVSTELSASINPIEQENNCQKFSTFFSLFKI